MLVNLLHDHENYTNHQSQILTENIEIKTTPLTTITTTTATTTTVSITATATAAATVTTETATTTLTPVKEISETVVLEPTFKSLVYIYFQLLFSYIIIFVFHDLTAILTNFYLTFKKLNNPKQLNSLINRLNCKFNTNTSTTTVAAASISLIAIFTTFEFEIKILFILIILLLFIILLILIAWKVYSPVIVAFKLNKGK